MTEERQTYAPLSSRRPDDKRPDVEAAAPLVTSEAEQFTPRTPSFIQTGGEESDGNVATVAGFSVKRGILLSLAVTVLVFGGLLYGRSHSTPEAKVSDASDAVTLSDTAALPNRTEAAEAGSKLKLSDSVVEGDCCITDLTTDNEIELIYKATCEDRYRLAYIGGYTGQWDSTCGTPEPTPAIGSIDPTPAPAPVIQTAVPTMGIPTMQPTLKEFISLEVTPAPTPGAVKKAPQPTVPPSAAPTASPTSPNCGKCVLATDTTVSAWCPNSVAVFCE